MKRWVGIIVLCLCTCLFLTGLTRKTSAADVIASGRCGENMIWVLESDGTLVISGKGEMMYCSDDLWEEYRKDITQVVLEEGVTSIDDYAFRYCTNLSSVTIPASIKHIDYEAFSGCSSLESITIPEGVERIGSRAFYGCSKLASINYLSEAAADLYYQADVFAGAGQNSEGISVIFGERVKTVPDYIFFGSSSNSAKISKVYFSESITRIGNFSFSGCKELTLVDIPKNVKNIGDRAFEGCSGILSVQIANGVECIGRSAFRSCINLMQITIPESVKQLGEYCFDNCTALTMIRYNAKVAEGLLYDSSQPYAATPMFFDGAGSNTSGVTIFVGETVERIPAYLFDSTANNVNAKSITIAENVTSIGTRAFAGCRNLQTLNYNAKQVSDIGYGARIFANAGCNSNGVNVVFGEGINTIPDELFYVLSGTLDSPAKITHVTLSDGTAKIGTRAFSGCKYLESVVFPDSIQYIGDSAFSSTALVDVVLPQGVVYLGASAFAYCEGLEHIELSKNIINIEQGTFYMCTSLTEINLPQKLSGIGGSAFAGCSKLVSIYIPECVETIGDYVFDRCYSLTKIQVAEDNQYYCSDNNGVLFTKDRSNLLRCPSEMLCAYVVPETVTYISDAAFNGCSRLRSVCFLQNAPQLGYRVFQTFNESKNKMENIRDLTIYYISGKDGWTMPTWGDDQYPTSVWDGKTIPHEYTFTGWKWSGYSQASAVFTCSINTAHVKIVSGEIQSILTEPSCESGGCIRYIARVVFEGNTYMDEKQEVMDALGHTYSAMVIVPTCTEHGYTIQTCSRCNKHYTDAYIDALGHDWGVAAYAWADDYITVTAMRVCKRDGSHMEAEMGVIVKNVKKATCDAEGEIIYTATFQNQAFTTQTKTVKTPKLERPAPTGNPFADVQEGKYYYSAVLWAVESGVTAGTSATTFSPEEGCTRAQVVTFLWRAAGEPAPTTSNAPFADVTNGTYYYSAVLWAAENEITSGTSATTFSPDDTCTRAQIVTFLWRYRGRPEPVEANNPFGDVSKSVYYAKAVLWAAGNGVTSGTSASTFSPDDTCTRAQVVTFLYRACLPN